ncbi:MAG TPA: efflux RND transporter periplasmic adaptor subunit [Polyangiaceae bacterium]|nr:efflux RND transporter periplasmic adaptor subunit [Polyangiaceae bacterium]
MSFEEERHCDSLSGTSIGPSTRSMPPSLRPSRRKRGIGRAFFWVAGVLLSAVGFVAAKRAVPERSLPDLLRVDARTVSYSASFAEHAGIRTIEVRERSFTPVLSASGSIDFERNHVATIDANVLGTVRRVAKYEGDDVKQGEVLAEMDSASQAGREAAGSLRARKIPRGTLGVSLLRSPLAGTVIERRVITGQSVRGESVVFVVANLERLNVDVNVDEAQGNHLLVGDRVELSREAAPGILGMGSVTGMERAASAKLRVHIGVDNRTRRLRPGQTVTARIFASQLSPALLVPTRALAWVAGQPTVFIAASARTASAAAVTLGGCDGEQTEIRLGLAAGQRVVTDGVSKLKEASFL